jgi:hypothetical protein
MMPDVITLLFKEVRDTFPPIKGKPSDDNLLLVRETLLPILLEIPFNQLGGVHSLTAILMDPTRYAADHGGATFVVPSACPSTMAALPTMPPRSFASARNWPIKPALTTTPVTRRPSKGPPNSFTRPSYNNLKNADTFYTKVMTLEIISFLDANSGGLHAIDMISLCTNMHQYYVQADGIPQYIIMLEDAQKKTKRASMPITDIKLVMMASAAVLAAQHFPREVNDWEGLPSSSRTWAAWKMAFRLAHLKRQRQILASGKGEPLGGAHGVLPAAAPAIGQLESALNNLALAAMKDTAILQQLTAANLALTALVTLLTMTNKKLVDGATRKGKPAVTPAVTLAGGGRATRNPFPGNYCWTHRHHISKDHMSASCTHKTTGHRDNATAAKTFGGSDKDKGWDAART